MSNQFVDRGPMNPHLPHVGVGLWISISHRFGPRVMEWFLAYILLVWGSILLLPSDTFSNKGYAIFRQIMPEDNWGYLFVFWGVLRLGGLVVNGARKQVTPWIRVVSAALGFLIWVGISTGFALSGLVAPWIAIYPTFAMMEMVNIWRASRDVGENFHAVQRSP